MSTEARGSEAKTLRHLGIPVLSSDQRFHFVAILPPMDPAFVSGGWWVLLGLFKKEPIFLVISVCGAHSGLLNKGNFEI